MNRGVAKLMVLSRGRVFIVVVCRAELVLWHMVDSQGARTVTFRAHGSRHAHGFLHGNTLRTARSPAVSHCSGAEWSTHLLQRQPTEPVQPHRGAVMKTLSFSSYSETSNYDLKATCAWRLLQLRILLP